MAHTIDPRIPQNLIPVTLTCLSILYPQYEQLPKPRIREYEFGPVLSQGCLCSGIRLLTDLQGEVQWGGEEKVAPEEVSYEREERGRGVNRGQEETRRGRVR
jgi:hypothetical protein